MNFTSPKTRIKLPVAKLFELTSNGKNLAHCLSNQAKDISFTEDTCTFTVDNIAQVTLKILEKTPFSQIRFAAENDKNIPLFLTLNYTAVAEDETDVEADLEIEVPIFLKPVLQKPLQRFMDTLSEKIKNNVEILGS